MTETAETMERACSPSWRTLLEAVLTVPAMSRMSLTVALTTLPPLPASSPALSACSLVVAACCPHD
jgi:hypothetical protein